MKQKLKKIINIFGMLILVSTIIVFSVIIGGNEKSLPIRTLCVLTGFSFFVLFTKKIFYKEKLIKNKIDISITIFMTTLTLPLIFKTFCSYEGEVEFILKYFFVYAMYLLARNIVDTRKKVNILIVTTIFSSLPIIIFGFDMLNGSKLTWLYTKLNLRFNTNYRFTTTFGYANAASLYMLFCAFLSINRIENLKNKFFKFIYCLYIILATYIIYISYSRLVLILYISFLFVYSIIKIYKKIKISKKVLKYIMSIIVLLIGIAIIYLVIAMQYSKPKEITGALKIKKKFNPNQEYSFAFEVDVLADTEMINSEFVVVETNKYFTKTRLIEIPLNRGRQVFEFSITPTEDLYYLNLSILNQEEGTRVIVNKCYIDGKEHIFSYKYVPLIVSRLIKSFAIQDTSIKQRIDFNENSLRIAKDSPIIGHGGNTWKRLSLAYIDYPYSVKETHSYFFELLISYGIVGVTAFLSIIALFCKDIIKEFIRNKEKRDESITIFIPLMIFLIYSITFDFTLSFILTIFIVFLYIALLQVGIESKEDTNLVIYKCADLFSLASIFLIFIILLVSVLAKYVVQDTELKFRLAPYVFDNRRNYIFKVCNNDLDEIKKSLLNEPYQYQIIMFRTYWDKLYKYSTTILDEDQVIDYMDFGLECFKKIKHREQMNFQSILKRVEIMSNIVVNFKNLESDDIQQRVQDIKNLMLKEYKYNLINITDENRNHCEKFQIENILQEYNNFLERAEIVVN